MMILEPATLDAFLANWAGASGAWAAALGGRSLRRNDAVAVYAGRPAFVANAVTPLEPMTDDTVEDLMQAVDEHYRFDSGQRTGRVLIFSAWPAPDLAPFGWSLLSEAPLMLRPAGGEMPEIQGDLRIEAVQDETALRDAEAITVRGFGLKDPEVLEPGGLFGPALLDDDRMRMWVGYEGETPVTTAACFVSEGITNIINVATIPEARGRGHAGAVTWRATLTEPSLPTLLIASDAGQRVYERMGYTTVRRFELWSRTSPEE